MTSVAAHNALCVTGRVCIAACDAMHAVDACLINEVRQHSMCQTLGNNFADVQGQSKHKQYSHTAAHNIYGSTHIKRAVCIHRDCFGALPEHISHTQHNSQPYVSNNKGPALQTINLPKPPSAAAPAASPHWPKTCTPHPTTTPENRPPTWTAPMAACPMPARAASWLPAGTQTTSVGTPGLRMLSGPAPPAAAPPPCWFVRV